MAKKKSSSKKNTRGGSGGRTSSSEPRVQTFRDFAGCNFQLSPRDMSTEWADDHEQSNLQMNYMAIQNNASIVDDHTIETRNNIVKLFDAPGGKKFTGICKLVDDELYAALNTNEIAYGKLGSGSMGGRVSLSDVDGQNKDNTWTCLDYADDKLIGMTKGLQVWTGKIGSHTLANAKHVPDPGALSFGNLRAHGRLSISSSYSESCAFRIGICQSYINKYGPTRTSDVLTFYASMPTDEWSSAAYVTISGSAPAGYAIRAVELYYVEGNFSEPSFLGRVDFPAENGGGWSYNWVGYLFDTSMWTVANLYAPTQNYTEGVPASKMIVHDGRLYFWGGNPSYRLWIGGNPGNLFSVSSGTGGGFVDVDPGSGQEIRVVPKYKTQSGNNIVTILTDSKNSTHEMRHNLVENNITLSSEQSMKSWQAEKVSGSVGCKSYNGARVCEDGLYAVSRYGLALTTMTMEYNSQIKTTYVSAAIRPAFTTKYGKQLSNSILLDVDGVLYMAFGKDDIDGVMDNVLFCYDVALKAWWTITLDVDEPILNLVHIDYEGQREGIGIVTASAVYMLPTTKDDSPSVMPNFPVLIESSELATTIPMSQKQYVSQMEFRFDYFVGDLFIDFVCIDLFGRKVTTTKHIYYLSPQFNLSEYMRIDMRCESYKIRFRGKARFRLTHFMTKTYTYSNKVGMVWGFDDVQSHNKHADIHPYFKDYNDIRKALIT